MSVLMLSACGGGGGGSSPSSSDTTIPAGHGNSLRPVSSATDFTIQVGQAPRRHITSLNDQTADAQTAQDQTTDSQDSSEQRQVEGQNVNNNGDTPSAPTGPNTDAPQVPADTTPPATPRLSLVDTGTHPSDGITYNVFKDSSDATLAELWVDQDKDVAGITADSL